ncbi:hypothetical protein [Pseudogulbenkiania subflava]|uniref:hypothetical protein n=1 Tax=Pseudogulbenkiania subflava TaxID=451637 RepID=UPI000A1565F0|nr:hypothetical protein [Pseudogulbenkiania subflava]
MDADLQLKVLAHVKFVAMHYFAFKGSLETIITFVAYSMGSDSPSPDRLDNFLRRAETQRRLENEFETALFMDTAKVWHLVSLVVPMDVAIARRRLNHRPISPGTQCRWCLADSKGFAGQELKPELDIYRQPVPGSFLHPQCMRPWLAMRALCDREN